MKLKKTAALAVVKLVSRVLDEKKGDAITVLDVSAQSSITDYLVIATATSEPHLRALRTDLEKVLDANHVHLVGMETAQESGWVVIDTFDVMIHLFLGDTRDRYGLERLWRDASEVPLTRLLENTIAKPAAPRKRTVSAAPRKRAKK
jgi:ribosome-associated protein